MKKLSVLLIAMAIFLMGCTTPTAEELALSSSFDITFDTLNKEENVAVFTVEGLPNDDEFAQITTVISDSLQAQEITGEYQVDVYSSMQTMDEVPYFGTMSYKDGEIKDNNLANITIEQYLNTPTTKE